MSETINKEIYKNIGEKSLAERLLLKARKNMFRDFVDYVQPHEYTSMLDVGVSDVQSRCVNWLEHVYPYPSRIHACGSGDGEEFSRAFPKIGYTKIVPNARLPFYDSQFDVATCNAVLEHAGSSEDQRRFLVELCRVAQKVFLTVPHRYFLIEHHTGLPFLHYFDWTFDIGCRLADKEKWLKEKKLTLMTRQRLHELAPEGSVIKYSGLSLGPISSNLMLFIDQTANELPIS